MTLTLGGPLGELNAKAENYTPLADVLNNRIVSFGKSRLCLRYSRSGYRAPYKRSPLMVHAAQVLPIAGELNQDFSAAQRLNKVLATYAERGRIYNFIAAPAARSALSTTNVDMFCLSAVLSGQAEETHTLEHVLDIMKRLGNRPVKDGKAVEDWDETRMIISQDVSRFLNEKLPLFRRLGCL